MHTLHRFGQVGVRKVGDVLGEDRIDGARVGLLDLERLFETFAVAGDDDLFHRRIDTGVFSGRPIGLLRIGVTADQRAEQNNVNRTTELA
jgi:hypothetical protein